jgi:signal transduction histidine kinase
MRAPLPARLATLLRHAALVGLIAAACFSDTLFCRWDDPGSCNPRPLAQLASLWAVLCLGVGVLWSLVLAGSHIGARTRLPLWLQWSVTALVAGLAGALVGIPGVEHRMAALDPGWHSDWDFLALWGPVWHVLIAASLVVAHGWSERSRRLDQTLRDAELERVAQERSLAEAQARLLQAQIEPHFIFNALANVRRLLRTDAPAAEALLDDLLRYLEEALPHLRDAQTTLGREAELVRAYLAVHQVRMGGRLRAEIDVPAPVADWSVPPMLLLTLVENALKHGLQPLVEGGTIRVAAHAQAGLLTLTVADTGRGMGSGLGGGTGLANTRARLRSMYGGRADLTLEVNSPRGVLATIRMPAQLAA